LPLWVRPSKKPRCRCQGSLDSTHEPAGSRPYSPITKGSISVISRDHSISNQHCALVPLACDSALTQGSRRLECTQAMTCSMIIPALHIARYRFQRRRTPWCCYCDRDAVQVRSREHKPHHCPAVVVRRGRRHGAVEHVWQLYATPKKRVGMVRVIQSSPEMHQ
jgi:hypothetical protein